MKNKAKRTPSQVLLNRKRLKVEELLLIVIFVLISIGAVYFGQYTVKQMEYAQRAKGYYNDHARGFRIYLEDRTTPQFDVNPYFADVISRHPDCAVYAYTTMPLQTSLVITAFNGTIPFDLDVKKGTRFMTAEESVGNEPVSVMGYDVYNRELGNKMYYSKTDEGEFFTPIVPPNTPHEIIGLCGREGSQSKLSTVTFLNMGSYPISCYLTINYIMDGPNAEALDGLQADLADTFGALGFDFRTTDLPSESFTVANFFAMDRLNLIMRVFAVFCVVMSTVPLTLYWSMRRKKATAVRRLLGRSVSSQAFRMLGRLMLLFHIGFAIGCIGSAIVLGADLFSGELLVAYLAGLAVNMGIAAVPLVQTMRVEPGDALRRE